MTGTHSRRLARPQAVDQGKGARSVLRRWRLPIVRWIERSPVVALVGAVMLVALSATTACSTEVTTAPFAVLIDAGTGKVLFERNADDAVAPGGMTKLMTLLVVFEQMRLNKLSSDTAFVVSEHAWRLGGAVSSTSSMFLDLYAKVPLEELIAGMAIVSANDAAIAVSEGVAGTEGAFVSRMNDQAQKLGLKHTTFANATGFDDAHHRTSARDLANLTRHLIQEFPDRYSAFGRTELEYRGVRFGNKNPLLEDNFADGVATGFVQNLGYGLVASTARNGRRLIGVVIGTKTAAGREVEMRRLLAYGFGGLPPAQPATKRVPTQTTGLKYFECRNYFPSAGVVLAVPCIE
jgi:D-alanyl-D-alanine carboxypeptidase (penicillin-binding protein 5/6)